MDYIKYLIKKEGIQLGDFEVLTQIFEMLSNQQEIKNITKKALSMIKDLEGEVSLIHYSDNKMTVMNVLGDRAKIDAYLENKNVLKRVRETKKPYFDETSDLDEPEFFMVLPILSKDEFLGALVIHDEQKIKNWKEIYTFLHLTALIFKYYNLIESNKHANTKDVVTTLYNYRHFQDQLDLEIEKHVRHYIPVTLLMFDICDFRLINEKLGTEGGDEVLKQLANWIKDQCRRIDMPVRLEADTFAVLLTNTTPDGAEALKRRILLKVKNNTINVNGKELKIKLKTSITPYEQYLSKDEFIELAKENLE